MNEAEPGPAPPVLDPLALGPSSPAGDLVRACLTGGVRRLVRHEPGARRGGDPEDVHQARVATRRLRSDLRTFASLLDHGPADRLREELGWLGAELGHVRDADVLLGRLRHHCCSLTGADVATGAALLRTLEDRRAVARRELVAVLDTDRYAALVEALVVAGARPPFCDQCRAAAPAAELAPDVVKRPWAHLSEAVGSLPDEPGDEALHRIRIRAKRVRYAAEAVAPVVGKRASRLAKRAAALQAVLGDLHDAVVAERWLREAGTAAPSGQALVAGQLIVRERAEQARARSAWREVWDDLDAKKVRSWLA
ncbi:MAG TPA: CHAD domain-containing protein [Acidimicrobiales bacterium]|nr:CHAD domain-containing protein [Acidimicrobiales bacterium]